MLPLLLVLAIAPQQRACPPGVSCPPPSYVQGNWTNVRPMMPGEANKAIYEVAIGGMVYDVWGWPDPSGKVNFIQAENLERLARPKRSVAPAPRPAAPPEPRPFPSPEPPIDDGPGPVFAAKRDAAVKANYGIDVSRTFAARGEHYQAASPAGRAFVADAKARSSSLADDSGKPHLSVIGDTADTAPVVKDFAPGGPLAAYRDKVHLHEFTAAEWQVTQVKMPADGRPAILLQAGAKAAKPGRVLLHRRDYAGGGRALASQLASALREPDPDYDPAKDPDPSAPLAGLGAGLGMARGVSIGVIALGGLYFLAKKLRKAA